jgi:hypothetical protein
VTRGQRAIHINAPLPLKRRDRARGEPTDETITLFKAVAVFAQDQVAPLPDVQPTPLEPPCQPLTGDRTHTSSCRSRLRGIVGLQRELRGPLGSGRRLLRPCRQADRHRHTTTAERAAANLIHETAHALGVHYSDYGRDRAEVIVDTVTHLAAGSLGLDVSGESIAYIAGWGEDGALEAVTTFAKTIDDLARKIEAAFTTPPNADRTAAPRALEP